MLMPTVSQNLRQSASSWGCELKYLRKQSRNCRYSVSLFVRLWVEIRIWRSSSDGSGSASSWGCELKCQDFQLWWLFSGSASSWGCELKCELIKGHGYLAVSASSWGCELKYLERGVFALPLGQPLREAVSWNAPQDGAFFDSVGVSLFVRLWVEIARIVPWVCRRQCQPLREAVSWNEYIEERTITDEESASSWGCELKYCSENEEPGGWMVSLFVRLWVEIKYSMNLNWCEVVSLFVRLWVEINRILREIQRKKLSASSWGCELKYFHISIDYGESCQPLREAVSWNIILVRTRFCQLPSASSWGCELKYMFVKHRMDMFLVSLFVRLWVEMRIFSLRSHMSQSASSWGCELKYNRAGRRWLTRGQPLREAVSWNAWKIFQEIKLFCQPLREAVSWNLINLHSCAMPHVSLFVRLWVEMLLRLYFRRSVLVSLFVRLWVEIRPGLLLWFHSNSQPLREAVSWNNIWVIIEFDSVRQPLREAVSWNYNFIFRFSRARSQPLREAVSWNTWGNRVFNILNRQPLREAVSWNYYISSLVR